MTTHTPPTRRVVERYEVWSKAGPGDPHAEAVLREAKASGYLVASAIRARVYLVECEEGSDAFAHVRERLLADPVVEELRVGARQTDPGTVTIEVHPLPGVMDPVAQSIQEAVAAIWEGDVRVSTGVRYDMFGPTKEQAVAFVSTSLANPVIHAVHSAPFRPESLPRGTPHSQTVRTIPICDLDDPALEKLSRDAHMFLSITEMRAVRDHYKGLRRDPTDIELETIAQTWSEHCVHKTLKSSVVYRETPGDFRALNWNERPGHALRPDGSVVIHNLLKSTVAAATNQLIRGGVNWTLSVFKDNSGVIEFDAHNAVCIKVETHNHPSALEPYGGAATGIGGCIRDIIGTGLGARPIASTDVFCVAPPSTKDVPAGCIHPGQTLRRVVAGVRDYGNRMGIPTVNGAVAFDERYVGNPLVFCGCIGVMPRDRTSGKARAGDLIVALGGRTGRDGIHGATFSSVELTDTHADEFSHAVQIGNAIEEKRLLDAILRARDSHERPLYTAITDCGAGGFSSAVGEMGASLGAEVHLDRAPLKYDGLSYTEVWISEAQERMILAVPPDRLDALRAICNEETVELCVLGTFGTPDEELVLLYKEAEVGRVSMDFLHNGIPMPTREAIWDSPSVPAAHQPRGVTPSARDALFALLADPDIASKHWIITQYDHEVQGNVVVKPLVGPVSKGPGDAAVIEPVPGTGRGLAIACGLRTSIGDPRTGGDPYEMALAGIDECVRNLVCVGADPSRIAILDNFCWPGCHDERSMGALVRACEGCYDGAIAYGTPFVSGKDSLNNQFAREDGETIRIPPTLLITGIGIVQATSRARTMDAKRPGSVLLVVGEFDPSLGGSRLAAIARAQGWNVPQAPLPRVDLAVGPETARIVAGALRNEHVLSVHDVSDGGVLCAIAEMLIAGSSESRPLGAEIDLSGLSSSPLAAAFAEPPSCYVLEVDADHLGNVQRLLNGASVVRIGRIDDSGVLRWPSERMEASVSAATATWRAPLDW